MESRVRAAVLSEYRRLADRGLVAHGFHYAPESVSRPPRDGDLFYELHAVCPASGPARPDTCPRRDGAGSHRGLSSSLVDLPVGRQEDRSGVDMELPESMVQQIRWSLDEE